eukprot:247370-Pelagomonas_calceolata.AAC.1
MLEAHSQHCRHANMNLADPKTSAWFKGYKVFKGKRPHQCVGQSQLLQTLSLYGLWVMYFPDASGLPLEGCDWKAWYRAQWYAKVCVVCPHDPTGSMGLLWGQIVQTSPIMGNLLTENTLQVIHVNLGSGMYSSSKLLSTAGAWHEVEDTLGPQDSATVMLRNSGQARGGRQQGGGPRIKS